MRNEKFLIRSNQDVVKAKKNEANMHIFVFNENRAVHITCSATQTTIDEVCVALKDIVGLIRGTYVLSYQGNFLSGDQVICGPFVHLNIHFLILDLNTRSRTPIVEYLPSSTKLIQFPSSSKSSGHGAEN